VEYSSTETYANRYDLNEIDVFIDGDGNNPMYFSIEGILKQFAFGKHYFNLSLLDSIKQDHQFRENSRILFEFKSINNVVLRSNVVKLNQRNGVMTGYFEVLKNPLRTFKEVEDGEGSLTVVGSLENKSTTKNLIPKKFLGAMNYRCTFSIDIRKNLINADAPTILQSAHELKTTLGRFSFSKASISTPANSKVGYIFSPTGVPANPPQIIKGDS